MAFTLLPNLMLGGSTALNVLANDENIEVNEEGQTLAEVSIEASKNARANTGYFNPYTVDFSGTDYREMADVMQNIPPGRVMNPLPYHSGYQFPHRDNVADLMSYTRIGDCVLMIPPTFIGVFNDGAVEEVHNIRQKGTTKTKQGFNKREIVMTLFFCGMDQINGRQVESPHSGKHYYMDGLRSLIAQFKMTPFLPIQNVLLNATYGISTVALSSMQVSTVEGFPECLEVTLNLLEFNSEIYTEVPNAFFTDMIDWDLFRFGYQRLLNDSSIKGYLPPASSKTLNTFSISLINQEIFNSDSQDDFGKLKLEDIFVKQLTEADDVHLTHINFGVSNILPQIEMPAHSAPAIQYMGCTDSRVQLIFETLDTAVVSTVEQIIDRFRSLSRQFKDFNHLGFLRLENEYTQLTGTELFVIDQVESTTVPEFPGLFKISMTLIGFDFRQQAEDDLKGMRPFNRLGVKNDAISQNLGGVLNRIKQHNYIELQMMKNFELYPDLALPTYEEINKAIREIKAYRQKKGLTPLPYDKYPEPTSLVPGKNLRGTYTYFLDPDYYVMYPLQFKDIKSEYINKSSNLTSPSGASQAIPDLEYGERYVQDKRNIYAEKNGMNVGVDYSGQSGYYKAGNGEIIPDTNTTLNATATDYVKLLREQDGKQYVWGATGQFYNNIQSWDCSGFVCWGLWQLGLWKDSQGKGMRFTTSSFNAGEKAGYWRYISFNELQPGDLCLKVGHVGVFSHIDDKGNYRTIEAMNPKDGVCFGWVKDSRKSYYTHYARITAFETGKNNRSTTVNNYNNYQHPEGEAILDFEGNTYRPITNNTSQMRTDMKFDARVTPSVLEKHLLKNMRGTGTLIYNAAKSNNIDPALLTAIAKLETGHGTSSNYLNKKNPGGIMDPSTNWSSAMTFSSLQKGYDYMASNLYRNYIGKGLQTIQAIGNKYCPVGAANDPTGLNSNWVPNVTKFYSEIKQTAYSITASDVENALIGTGSSTSGPSGFNSPTTSNSSTIGRKEPVDVPFGYEEVENTTSTFKQDGAGTTVNDKTYSASKIDVSRLGEPYVQVSPLVHYMFEHAVEIDSYKSGSGKEKLFGTSKLASFNDLSKFYTSYKLKSYGIYDFYEEGEKIDRLDARFIEKMCKEKLIHYMCVDEKQYSCKGRLLRAFPTFVFMVVDDGGEWLDGRKLWSNYYLYRSIISIEIFQEEAQPVHTATILINDSYDKLSTTPTYPLDIYKKTFVENDTELFKTPLWGGFKKWWYEQTGSLLGGPKLTQDMIDVKNVIHDAIKIKPGCRVHIRMGYGSNPINLPIMFNGIVAELEQEENFLQLIAQSDGAELLHSFISSKEDDRNNFMYLQSEPSNIIISMLTERNNKFTNYINSGWGEPNKFGIESFGINLKRSVEGGATKQKDQFDLNNNIFVGKYKPQYVSEGAFLNADGEENFNFFLYGKYPWDTMQACAQFLPEFVCQPVYHQFESRIFYGLPFFPYRYRYDWVDTDELTSVFETAKIFTQHHIIDSYSDIVRNRMKATSKGLKTNMVGLYTLGGSSESTPTLYSDRTIDWSKQATGIVDTTVIQDYFGPDMVYANTLWDVGRPAAIKIGISNLLDGWSKTYRGELIVLGNPGIKPCDHIFLNDSYNDMNGTFKVRQIMHAMSGNKGYTTSIVPGMIAVSADQKSGSINVLKGTMSFCGGVMFPRLTRSLLVKTFNHLGNAAKASGTIDWILKRSATQSTLAVSKTTWNAFKTGSLIGDYANSIAKIKQAYKTVSAADDFTDMIAGVRAGVSTGKRIKDIALIAQGGITATAGTVVPIVGNLVAWLATEILINSVLTWVFDQFQWNNCVKLMPLSYKGSAFVVNSKGSKNLLLMDYNALQNSEVKSEEDEELEVE